MSMIRVAQPKYVPTTVLATFGSENKVVFVKPVAKPIVENVVKYDSKSDQTYRNMGSSWMQEIRNTNAQMQSDLLARFKAL